MTNGSEMLSKYLLDITGDRCPMTFVKTRLRLDKMQPGETLTVRLREGEALQNVPRSARELGHTVSEIKESGSGIFEFQITKA